MSPSNQYTLNFRIDNVKARDIGKILYHDFYEKRGFFKDYRMPEYILPNNLVYGSKEHALYLTYVISMDYMTDAVKLWRQSREEYTYNPDSFTPEKIVSLGEQTLKTLAKRLGARYPSNAALNLRKISEILLRLYEGDPRKITTEPLSIEQLRSRIEAFPYLRGRKLFNFYLRAMGENGLLKISNFHELDIPVDIQVARFTIYTGVLGLDDGVFRGCVHEPPLRDLIEEAWRDAAHVLGTYPWKLDEPIWTVGSKLCSKKKCEICPVQNMCGKFFDVSIQGSIAVWSRARAI